MEVQLTAKIENETDVANLFLTAMRGSKFEALYVLSNGELLKVAYRDYKIELEAKGFWVVAIFEYGNRVEA